MNSNAQRIFDILETCGDHSDWQSLGWILHGLMLNAIYEHVDTDLVDFYFDMVKVAHTQGDNVPSRSEYNTICPNLID